MIEIGVITAATPSPDCDEAVAEVVVEVDGRSVLRQSVTVACGSGFSCTSLPAALVPAGARRVEVVLAPQWSNGGAPDHQPLVGLDRVFVAADRAGATKGD